MESRALEKRPGHMRKRYRLATSAVKRRSAKEKGFARAVG